MADRVVLMLAEQGGRPVAGALTCGDASALRPATGAASANSKFLHFETCYYQAIEYANRAQLRASRPAPRRAQDPARLHAGAKPGSAHWISDPGFAAAVEDFLKRERPAVEARSAGSPNTRPSAGPGGNLQPIDFLAEFRTARILNRALAISLHNCGSGSRGDIAASWSNLNSQAHSPRKIGLSLVVPVLNENRERRPVPRPRRPDRRGADAPTRSRRRYEFVFVDGRQHDDTVARLWRCAPTSRASDRPPLRNFGRTGR